MKQSSSMLMGDAKKKRLSNEQLELLENCFQDEIKLDPERKIKLAKELGLQPRQIAVWFQNRRARWKGKQLERLYDALKQEYDAVSRDKLKLQQEASSILLSILIHSFLQRLLLYLFSIHSFSILSIFIDEMKCGYIYICMQLFCLLIFIWFNFQMLN